MKNTQNAIKSMTCLLLIAICNITPSKAQANPIEPSAGKEAKNTLIVGAGALNFMYFVVNRLDNANVTTQSDSFVFSTITTNTTAPLYYLKYENKLGKRHALGLSFANSGFTVGGLVRDSFFLNDLGTLTQLNIKFKYKTNSLNVRYNYTFNPDAQVKIYWGLGIGLRTNKVSITTNDSKLLNQFSIPGINIASVPTVGFESTLGFKGTIADQLGWYAEMGVAKSVFQGGISYSF
jgi:opacity protein-like surface antigen